MEMRKIHKSHFNKLLMDERSIQGMRDLHVFASVDEVEFFITKKGSRYYIYIKETEAYGLRDIFKDGGWLDIIRDLAFWPKSIKGTHGHAGFVHGWSKIHPYIDRIRERNPEASFVLYGYSMGGGIAAIGGYWMMARGWNLAEVVTMGAPRSLNLDDVQPATLDALKIITTQYQHVRDPIPAALRWMRYNHIDHTFVGGKKRAGFFKLGGRFHSPREYFKAYL